MPNTPFFHLFPIITQGYGTTILPIQSYFILGPTAHSPHSNRSETSKRISYHISLLQFLWWQLNKIQTSPHCLPQPYGTFHWHLLTSSVTASPPSPSLILNPPSVTHFFQTLQTLDAYSQIMDFELPGSFHQSNFILIPCLYCRDMDAPRDCHAEGSRTNILY